MNLIETYRRAISPPPSLVVVPPRAESDARGGFATPAAPQLLPPGATDPRVRAFTKSIVDPQWTNNPQWQALPDGEKQNIIYRIPPPEDLDRVALFAPPAPGYNAFTWPGGPGGGEDDPSWANIVALGDGAVKSSLSWWRQALALGPLPEDDEYTETETREPSYGWPKNGTNRTRKIYFWGYGKDGKLYQHMQLQKQDSFDNWKIFNQWGQNLTFVKQSDGRWVAGWDFGDWFTQNKLGITAGIQIVFQALVTALSLGTAAPGTALATAATVGAVLAANQALQGVFTGIATGDWNAALASMIKMATDLASVPEVKAALDKNKDIADFVKSEPVQTVGKITAGMKWPPTLQEMVNRAGVLAKDIPITPDLLKTARAQVPDQMRVWFDVAYQKGKDAVSDRVNGLVPWYAQGTWDYAATLGAFVDAKTYYGNVAKSGAGEQQYTLAQTIAMMKQQVQQGGTDTWRQALNQTAGVKAPKHLPGKDSRSPPPASEKSGLGGLLVGGGLIALLVLAARFFLR